MQSAIHQEKNPDIYRFDVRLFVAMFVGCIFYSVGLIIPRKSPCINVKIDMTDNKGQQSLISVLPTFYKFRKLETIGNCTFGCI
jgi:hypothetical protein